MNVHFDKENLQNMKLEFGSAVAGLNKSTQVKLVDDCLEYQEHLGRTNQALQLAKDTLEKVQQGIVDQTQIAATIQEIWVLL